MADFEKLYQDNRELIFKYLLKLSGDGSLAEELAQETFFRAYINIGKLRDESKVAVWLCQIAKNLYYAWYNEHKRLLGLDTADEAALPTSGDLADRFADKELSRQAFQRLHELGEPYKEVFMLSVFGNLSLKDISGLFGKSESWARVTLYRAKQKLKESMR